MSERFVGFYTSRPFWAIDDVSAEDEMPKNFHELMEEIVFDHREDKFKIMACRDGMILLQIFDLEAQSPFSEEPPPNLAVEVSWWSHYLEYLNCLYLLLDSSVLEVMSLAYLQLSELTRRDAIRVELEDDRIIGQSLATESYAAMYQMGRSSLHLRIIMRLVFPKKVFVTLAQKASVVFMQPWLVSNLAKIARSLSAYNAGNYSVSLVLAWFVIESLLAGQWNEFLSSKNQVFKDGSKRINSDRMKSLTEGRDYTISVISNVLELADLLPFDVFRRVDAVRGYRNKVVHQIPGFECTEAHCREAIDLARDLSLQGCDIPITLNYYSYSVHGP